ncbi:MAG: hypothetical protein U0871_05095 [Gemmataceae bacterium]
MPVDAIARYHDLLATGNLAVDSQAQLDLNSSRPAGCISATGQPARCCGRGS